MQLDEDPIVYEDGIHFVEEEWGDLNICRAYNKIYCDVAHRNGNILIDVSWFVEGNGTFIETLHGSGTFSYSDLPALLTTQDLIEAGFTAGITVIYRFKEPYQT